MSGIFYNNLDGRSDTGEALLDLFFKIQWIADHTEGIADASGA